jgi:hypothetical protein
MALHRVYGLTVRSDFPIPAPRVSEGDPDVTVTSGPARAVPEDPPPGTILAETGSPWPRSFTTRTDDGYVMRFPDVCDVHVDRDLARVELYPATESARPLSHILFSGTVLARILTLAGECILHASAVRRDGKAMGFVGHSGAGKSTLAALMCARGGRLITDDLLRLVPRNGAFDCISGTSSIRLRPAAVSLTLHMPGTVGEEADGRTSVTLEEEADRFPLGVLVFPQPSRTASEVQTRRLDPGEALLSLTSAPRTLGWVDPEMLKASFRWNARLAREVPTFAAEIPWGPPFDPAVAPAILSLLDTEVALSRGAV